MSISGHRRRGGVGLGGRGSLGERETPRNATRKTIKENQEQWRKKKRTMRKTRKSSNSKHPEEVLSQKRKRREETREPERK